MGLEQAIYNIVKGRPRLKNVLKWGYQRVFSTFAWRRRETVLELVERPQAFFGFHDKSPWSADGALLVGHTFSGSSVGERWRDADPIGISVFDGPHWTEQRSIAETRAWNWQQGAQLQWMGPGREVVYNDFREGRCTGVVRDVERETETLLSYPVAAVSADGERYASISFETLGRAMPGYGYGFSARGAVSSLSPCELVVRARTGSLEITVTLDDLPSRLAPASGEPEMDFFSHCLFSPDGERLLFLRRQSRPNRRLQSELYCLDLTARSIQRVCFTDMVSHFTWVSNDQVLAYARAETGGDGFYLVDPGTGSVRPPAVDLNPRDGHPHATPEGRIITFDTYPDRRRYQRLYVWRPGQGAPTCLGRFFSPMKFWGASRVDLHPRLRADGAFLSFDAGFRGRRSLVTARLPESEQ